MKINFFFGDDTFSLISKLAYWKDKFLKDHPSAVVEELVFTAETQDPEMEAKLKIVVESQGLFAPAKLVIIRDLLSYVNKLPLCENYISRLVLDLGEEINLMFVQISLPDRRLRLFKKLREVVKVQEFRIPQAKELEIWIKNRLKQEGFTIEKSALAKFVERLGEEYTLWQVDNELRKLILYRFASKSIILADVEEVVSANLSQNIFDLTGAVAEGEAEGAAKILERITAGAGASDLKNRIIQVVGATASQIRSLLLVKDLEGQDPREIAKALQWKEARVWINLKLAKKFRKERLIQLLSDLKAIDFRLKTSEEPPKLLLNLFFQKASIRA